MAKLIYINPGHNIGRNGNPDPGAVGPNGLTEAEVAKDLAERMGHLLRSKGYCTQSAIESYVEAVKHANASDANFFLCLHCNAAVDHDAGGVEVLYHSNRDKDAAQSVLWQILAQIVQGKSQWIGATPLRNRGLKLRTDLYVLNATDMPAILVECAFISNKDEEKLLRDHHFLQAMAQAIADGVHTYLGGAK